MTDREIIIDIRREVKRLDDFYKSQECGPEVVTSAILQFIDSLIAKRLGYLLLNAVGVYGEGGFNTNEFGKYVYVKRHTSDGSLMVYIDRDKLGEKLWMAFNPEFREKVIGFKPNIYDGTIFYYEPLFDHETQKIWDAGVEKYQRGVREYYASKKSGDYTGD